METSQGTLAVERMARNLQQPWGVDFLPSGKVIVTERGGDVLLITPDGKKTKVTNAPEVVVKGQGGLLDVMVPRDFSETKEIFLSAVIRQQRGTGTALIKLTLDEDAASFTKSEVIFQQARGFSNAKHFGSRIVEARDGTIFLTIGDRGESDEAQNTTNHNGSVVRVRRSGITPPDNPLLGLPGAEPEIYSYGHRNPQGAALDLDGNLWVAEHGAKGGDEVNKIKPGANYGWPVISYGTHYSGFKIGQGTETRGMEQPNLYWDPSIAPSGMMIYSGKLWPQWKGDIFVGSLKFDYIARLDGETLAEEALKSGETGRVRDVVEGPEGAIWFLSVDDNALYRVTP
jgi:glucose/arabinose dehydrogenase